MDHILRRTYIGLCSVLLIIYLAGIKPSLTQAVSTSPGSVTQSYNADGSVLPGMIVGLNQNNQSAVIPLNDQMLRNMTGVVVPQDNAPVVLTPQTATSRQVLVAGSGRYGVLVSNQNGSIKAGDYLSISALAGISMKASPSQASVIGRANTDFIGTKGVIGNIPLKDSLGRTTTAAIGYIPATVQLAPNPTYKAASTLPNFLSKAANGIANKQVSPIRVYLAAAVLAATLFITGTMFYGGVRGGVVATGRNPLAKRAIGRSLVQTLTAAMIIFFSGILALYLIIEL